MIGPRHHCLSAKVEHRAENTFIVRGDNDSLEASGFGSSFVDPLNERLSGDLEEGLPGQPRGCKTRRYDPNEAHEVGYTSGFLFGKLGGTER